MTQRKLPAFPVYTGDWRKDPGVQALDLEDRGFWWECLILMWECTPRGALMLNGRAMTYAQIANAIGVGLNEKIVADKVERLLQLGVVHKDTKTGALCSRRMLRDARLAQIRREAGGMGGNPSLLRGVDNQKPNLRGEDEDEDEDSKRKREAESLGVPVRVRGRAKGVLRDEQLDGFNRFWEAFSYKRGKSEAMGAWLDLKLNPDEIQLVIWAAMAEAEHRKGLPADRTPKWAEGWLSARRFEDEVYSPTITRLQNAQAEREKKISVLVDTGAKYGLTRREGESWPGFADRIAAAEREQKKGVQGPRPMLKDLLRQAKQEK